MSTSITRSLMGLAFASSLFLGCEQFTGGDKEGGKNLDVTPPEDMALQLSVKQTDECKALRDRVLAARNGGEPATADLEAGFIRNCIDEVKPIDGRPEIVLPPNLVPDARTRCHWIVAQIDGGHDELIIKFKYYCPDDCDTLARTDSLIHDRYCRDPKPDCEELRRKLANMDPASEEFARLKRFLDGNCGVRPPIDTIIRPKPVGYCDSLRHLLVLGFLDSASLHRVHRQLAEKCGRDTILPPKLPTLCDSLRHILDTAKLDSAAYARVKRQIAEHCGMLPVPLTCSQMKDQLSRLDPASAEYARIKIQFSQKCLQIEPPITDCEAYRAKLANLDPASPDYARLKALVAEKCVVIKPVP